MNPTVIRVSFCKRFINAPSRLWSVFTHLDVGSLSEAVTAIAFLHSITVNNPRWDSVEKLSWYSEHVSETRLTAKEAVLDRGNSLLCPLDFALPLN